MIKGFRCKYNIDDECIGNRCEECKNNPIYKQGRADAIEDFARSIMNALSDDMEVKYFCKDIAFLVCGIEEQLKEQKNDIYNGKW